MNSNASFGAPCQEDATYTTLCDVGGLEVSVALPSNAHSISFDFRYFLWDYPPFEDPFRVVLIAGETVSLIAEASLTSEFGTKDYGLLWGETLHRVAVDVSAYAGQTVTLRFLASDRYDTAVDGGAAIDNLSVTGHTVNVLVTLSGTPTPGVVTTITNTETGEYFLELSNEAGLATFEGIPNGSYLAHARNMVDFGPVIDGFQMYLAPLPPGSLFSTAGAEDVNRVGVLYDPTMEGSWAVLSPDNYSRLTASPAIVLSGGSSTRDIELRMQTGAIVDCTFRDASGNVISIDANNDQNVVLVLPFAPDATVPPPPPGLPRTDLPRGILAGAATVIAGQSSCGLAGVASTGGQNAVLEVPPVQLDGKEVIFVQNIQITDEQASTGSTVEATLVAEPRKAKIEYLDDPLGDAKGSTDILLTTYGWGVTDNAVNDIFNVSTRFEGLGYYSLYMAYDGTRVRIDVKCEVTSTFSGCRLYRKSSSSLQVAVSGAVDGSAGTFNIEVTLPGTTTVDFRIFTGSAGADDYAPDSGLQRANKPSDLENTWLIFGE